MTSVRIHLPSGTRSLFCALALSLCARVAAADTPPATTPDRFAAPSAASTGSTPERALEAAQHFKRGLQLFDDGDYVLALVEFERAYELAPNYRALYNIGMVCIQLGRYAEATRRLEAYLHDGGSAVAADRQASVAKTLAQLKLRTAMIDVSVNARGAEITIDGKPIEASRLKGPILIDAGEHTVRATAPGYLPQQRTLTLVGEDRTSVRLDLPIVVAAGIPSDTARRSHTIFWPGFVTAGALAAGAIVCGGVMLDARSKLEGLQNTPASDPTARERLANRANSTALAADVLTGLTILAGGASVIVTLSSSRSPRSTALAISPQSVAINGSF